MTVIDPHSYRFATAAHWEAGARRNLILDGDVLRMPDTRHLVRMTRTGPTDGRATMTVDPCGRLVWLRRADRVLVRRHQFGTEEVGRLDGEGPVRQLVVGPSNLWILTSGSVIRYGASDLQRFGMVLPLPAEPAPKRPEPPGTAPPQPDTGPTTWTPVAITSDGHDGLWLLERPGSRNPLDPPRLRHLDSWGWDIRRPIGLSSIADTPALASSRDGSWLVLIDARRTEELVIIDPAHPARIRRCPVDPVHREGRTLLAVDWSDRVHLLTVDRTDPSTARLDSLSRAGVPEQSEQLDLPPRLGTIRSLAAADDIAVAADNGLAHLEPCRDATRIEEGVFYTPVLRSPLAVTGGWDRAEIDVDLPEGTAMEVTWAATSEVHVVGAAAFRNLRTGEQASIVYELEGLLPWHGSSVRYEGRAVGPTATERLAALIDDAGSTYLWLRIRLIAPADRDRPVLRGLRVGYPDDSYLDELPALYREDPVHLADLRQVLAPFEVLFDGLDDELARLPDRIDPLSAGPDWTAFLLEWLGFPPLGDLPVEKRQALLQHASQLLADRGTPRALRTVLDLVTDGRATVTDEADEPDLWFLPAADGNGPRLGSETRIGDQQPPPTRAGDLVLGSIPLGRGCTDPALVLAQRAQLVTVQLDLSNEEHTRLRPVIDRLLDLFVPAHCRIRVVHTGIDGRFRSRQLDVGFRLAPEPNDDGDHEHASRFDGLLLGDAHWHLGAGSRLGCWRLATPPFRPAELDRPVSTPHQRLN